MPSLTEMRKALSPPVALIGLAASMGGFLFGSDTGQLSGYIVMPNFVDRFADKKENGVHQWGTTRLGLVVGMLSIGCLIGSLIAGPLGDRLGRRKSILLLCLVFYTGNTVFITSMKAWYHVIIARIISGLAIGGCSMLVPVYVSETVPKEVRGGLVACYQLFVTLGLLTSYLVNFGTSHVNNSAQWRGAIAVGYTWGILLGIGTLMVPESPRWLIQQGRVDQARKALTWVHGGERKADPARIDAEIVEMQKNVEEVNRVGKGNWLSSFNPKRKALYRTILGYMLQVFQQLTGANYFFYYGVTIFKSVGIKNSFVTQIILGAVNVICTFPGLYFIERFGRRKPLIFGGLWQMSWLIVFGAVGSELDPASKDIGIVMIVSACMFIASFASTWGPGIWVAMGELYPIRIRGSSASIATTGNWLWNFLLTFFTPLITNQISYRYGYVFAGCNALATATVFFFYYESSGLTLEQVDEMYNDPSVKPWTSGRYRDEVVKRGELDSVQTGSTDVPAKNGKEEWDSASDGERPLVGNRSNERAEV
ncbi:general substrate transporter [Ascodesmis nigricans]|uniref:General substrate transporter n=1 Tax=Ascodesmis nigricans TaxID=341454 RepID=A0A4S2MSF0_9PEZI|nr:general substrate transporter [Ascodesmis nigricans]